MTRSPLVGRVFARGLFISAIALIALLGSVVGASASGPSLPATITGYVMTAAPPVVPIEGVLVRVSGETSEPAPWDPWNTSFMQTAVTDASGRFVITDVIQGTYSMTVNEPESSIVGADYESVDPWMQNDWVEPYFDTRRTIMAGTTEDAGTIYLDRSGTVTGHVMDGTTPVAGSRIKVEIEDGGFYQTRWGTSGADGSFAVTNCPLGICVVSYSGSDPYVPEDADIRPYSGWSAEGDPVTEATIDDFMLDPGETFNAGTLEMQRGERVVASAHEAYGGTSFNIGQVPVFLYPTGVTDWAKAYAWQLDYDGWGRAYVPPGMWDLVFADESAGMAMYHDLTVTPITTVSGGPDEYVTRALDPVADSYALTGTLTEAGSGTNTTAWVLASKIDPSSSWPDFFRRVPSNGAGEGRYLIRLPKTTGYSGNKMKVEWSDMADPPAVPYKHVSQEATITPPSGASVSKNVSMQVGGKITGTIRDEEGTPVPGCAVWVLHKAFDPSYGTIAWTGSEYWSTLTDGSGSYEIGGLPTGSDYKLNVNPDYNPGWALPIKYKDYNRRTYKGQPFVDSLNNLVGAPVTDHTPIAVTAGATTGSIDETIVPGGYVGLHASGPTYPTGAVWCDVMYQYKGSWFEIDSGYTTGGTFEKLSKVLPAGHYKLNYNDYFGRGGGSWEFDLAGLEHKYASVLVPAPVSFMSGLGDLLGGSFAGIIGDGGLDDFGPGGAMLTFDTTVTPSGAPPLPKYTIALPGDVLDVSSTGTSSTASVWTLNLPYDPSVPDADVPYIRVAHYLHDGGVEYLAPIAWNLTNHTVQVQTSSLSPFRMTFKRHTVTAGVPHAASTWKKYKAYTVYGTLAPKHKAGVKSVKIKIYRKNSKGKYVYYKYVWAPNRDYKSGTRYYAKFALKAGKYRFKSYAVPDTWHLGTTSSKYDSVTVK